MFKTRGKVRLDRLLQVKILKNLVLQDTMKITFKNTKMNAYEDVKQDLQHKQQPQQQKEQDIHVVATAAPANGEKSSRRHIWRKRPFPSQVSPPPYDDQDIAEVATPAIYFLNYLNEQFFHEAAAFTNMYYMSKTGQQLGTTSQEIKKLFGVDIIMGFVKYPLEKMYWQYAFPLPFVANAMSRNSFFTLPMALHVVDTNSVSEEQKENRLWKVQPAIDAVRAMCLKLPRNCRQSFSIDEQMIPFCGHCTLKQYVPTSLDQQDLKISF